MFTGTGISGKPIAVIVSNDFWPAAVAFCLCSTLSTDLRFQDFELFQFFLRHFFDQLFCLKLMWDIFGRSWLVVFVRSFVYPF